MVKLNEAKTLNAALLANSRRPLVGVFLGGTSGIGHMTARARALASSAQQAGGHAPRIYLVGRSEQRGGDIVEELKGICPAGMYRFVRAEDLSLMACVDAVCAEIARLEGKEQDPRIDYLMTSHGGAIFQPRKDTKEGLDVTMAMMYYSRMRAIQQLTPLLLKSELPAVVVSVFAAGFEAKLFQDDLSLRDPQHYSYLQVRSHLCYMHSAYLFKLAETHSNDTRGRLRLVHIFPGLVLTSAFENPAYPAWFRFLFNRILAPLFLKPFVAVDSDESAARMLSLASPVLYPAASGGDEGDDTRKGGAVRGMDGRLGSGAYSLDWKGDDIHNRKAYAKLGDGDEMEALKTQIWEHTNKAFEIIAAGKCFTE